ncbi:M12 family metallo-peptidase [Pseudomonas palleroniana]
MIIRMPAPPHQTLQPHLDHQPTAECKPGTATLRTPKDYDRITTSFSATSTSPLDIKQTNLAPELPLPKDKMFSFLYSEAHKKWYLTGKDVNYSSPFRVGSSIPNYPAPITLYSISSNNWIPAVSLPTHAKDNDVIVIDSSADKPVTIEGENIVPAQSTTLNKDEKRIYQYSEIDKGWKLFIPQKNPAPSIAPIEPKPVAPVTQETKVLKLEGVKTQLLLDDTVNAKTVKLPDIANDNDLVRLKSNARQTFHISTSNINNRSAMTLEAGEEYIFKYIAKNKKWEMIRAPEKIFNIKTLANGQVPDLSKPKTYIEITESATSSSLRLPGNQPPGSEVIVHSSSSHHVIVDMGDFQETVKPGEVVVFKVDNNKKWKRETVTIDLLFLYNSELPKEMSRDEIQKHVKQSMNETNQALVNSGANFTYRAVAVKEFEDNQGWAKTNTNHVLKQLIDDPRAQAMLDEVKADGMFYLTNFKDPDASGRAFLGPGKREMIATSNTYSTYVIRHELAHNMGVNHAGDTSGPSQGLANQTVMGYSPNLYYSTPHRYTDEGEPLGTEGKIDAVGAMNKISAEVAAYR